MGRMYNDEELTDWEYSTSSSGSTKIARYTVGAVTAALIVIAASRGVSPVAAAIISSIASRAISEELSLIYYDQDVYYKYLLDTDPQLPRAEKTITNFYSDSARTNQLGDTVICENYI